jgi:hypothetical protein
MTVAAGGAPSRACSPDEEDWLSICKKATQKLCTKKKELNNKARLCVVMQGACLSAEKKTNRYIFFKKFFFEKKIFENYKRGFFPKGIACFYANFFCTQKQGWRIFLIFQKISKKLSDVQMARYVDFVRVVVGGGDASHRRATPRAIFQFGDGRGQKTDPSLAQRPALAWRERRQSLRLRAAARAI